MSYVWRSEEIRQVRLFKTVLIFLFLSIAFLMAWIRSSQYALSGFFFRRLGDMVMAQANGTDVVNKFRHYPYSPFYMLELASVTGVSVGKVIYFPVVSLGGLVAAFPISKVVTDDTQTAVVASVLVFLTYFIRIPHYREYGLSAVMFLFFLYCFYCALFTQNRRRFIVLSMLVFLAVKLLGPPMETWAITMVVLTICLILIAGQTNEKMLTNSPNIVLAILFVIIMLSYAPRIPSILSFDIGLSNLSEGFLSFFVGLLSSKENVITGYQVTPSNSPFLRTVNIIRTLQLGIPVALYYIYKTMQFDLLFWTTSKRQLFVLAITFSYISELFLYLFVGFGINLRYVYLTFPIIAVFYLAQVMNKNHLIALVFLFMIVSGSSFYLTAVNDVEHEYSGTDSLVDFLEAHSDESPQILADHKDFNIIRFTYTSSYSRDNLIFMPYNNERYAEITSDVDSESYEFDYLYVNKLNTDHPITQGPPGWQNYQPIGQNLDKIVGNNELCTAYDGGNNLLITSCRPNLSTS